MSIAADNSAGDTKSIEVALFPIPGSVTFPGVRCPLHVFEPRYRQMVRYCIDNHILMGVCHTEKVVSANTREQTLKEALSSNQSTYKPNHVFSAGQVDLLSELDDGRMMISVDTSVRLTLEREQQTLPFSVWRCRTLADEPTDATTEQAMLQLKEKILQRLIAVTHGQTDVQQQLQTDYWQNMPAGPFSFAVCGILGMDPELAQHLLETTDPQYRLSTVLELLNHALQNPLGGPR